MFLNYFNPKFGFLGNQFIPAFINKTDNLCAYFKNPMSQMLIHLIYPSLQKSGKLPTSCPVQPVSFTYIYYYLYELVIIIIFVMFLGKL